MRIVKRPGSTQLGPFRPAPRIDKETFAVHVFETELVWKEGKECQAKAREKPALTVATPPEFGGPGGVWSPEELFVAAVETCLMSTLLYFTDRFELPLRSYTSSSKGVVERTLEGLRFTGIDVAIHIAFSSEEVADKASALHLRQKLEKYCPVSASLDCPVRLTLEVQRDGDAANQVAQPR
jgi:organic hydroperoxide reductase OsmC/OhrA